MRPGAFAVVAAVLSLLVLGGLAWAVYTAPDAAFGSGQPAPRDVTAPPPTGGPLLLTVESGSNPATIGRMLQEQGVIASGRHFEVLVGLMGVADSLEAGEYEFDRSSTALEAVTRIADGRTASRHVVIPEGLRAEEIGEILEQAGIVTKDAFMLALVKDEYTQPFLAQVSSTSLQGFLFPAAYEFRRDTTPHEVVDTLLLGFQTNVADQLQLEGQPFSLEEVVALAAIVEREATEVAEHPIIASVFENRLAQGIPLQADPTVQFALSSDPANVERWGWWKEELTLEDLEFDSPYNTYRNAGLTPGPIANPGLDTIQSVVRPAATQYLYFVARGDGTHAFAETLEQHLANVEQYQ